MAGLRAGVRGPELGASVLQQRHLAGFPQAVSAAAPPALFTAMQKVTVDVLLPYLSKGATPKKAFHQRQEQIQGPKGKFPEGAPYRV